MISVQIEKSDQFAAAEEFYKSVEYFAPIEPHAQVFSAREGDQIIGVVRLVTEEGHLVLRGMMISPDHQRKGVGKKILELMDPVIGDQECWCLPHDWLKSFYGHIGFKEVPRDIAPEHLKTRLDEHLKKYPNMIVMKR